MTLLTQIARKATQEHSRLRGGQSGANFTTNALNWAKQAYDTQAALQGKKACRIPQKKL